jgi:hypothetical protein
MAVRGTHGFSVRREASASAGGYMHLGGGGGRVAEGERLLKVEVGS